MDLGNLTYRIRLRNEEVKQGMRQNAQDLVTMSKKVKEYNEQRVRNEYKYGKMSDQQFADILRSKLGTLQKGSAEQIKTLNELERIETKINAEKQRRIQNLNDFEERKRIDNLADYLKYLNKKAAALESGTDEQIKLLQEAARVEKDIDADVQRRAERRIKWEYDNGKMSSDQYIAILKRKMASEDEWSEKHIALLNEVKRAEDRQLAESKANLDKQGKAYSDFVSRIKNVGMSLGIVFAAQQIVSAAGRGTKEIISLGVNARETQNKFREVFKDMSAVTDQWAKDFANDFGFSKAQMREWLSSLQALLVPMGVQRKEAASMSQELVELAADWSSFFNLPVDEVLTKIRAGLVGETEPMRTLGVVINETRVKQQAMTDGLIKQGQELTESQKVLTRYKIMLKDSADAQGDLARTMNDPANQMRRTVSLIKDIGTDLGTLVLPAFNSVLTAVNGVVGGIRDLTTSLADQKPNVQDLADEYITLASKTKLTNDEKERLKGVVDKLISIFPDLNLEIETQTGLLKLNSDELERNVKNYQLSIEFAEKSSKLRETNNKILELENKNLALQNKLSSPVNQQDLERRKADLLYRLKDQGVNLPELFGTDDTDIMIRRFNANQLDLPEIKAAIDRMQPKDRQKFADFKKLFVEQFDISDQIKANQTAIDNLKKSATSLGDEIQQIGKAQRGIITYEDYTSKKSQKNTPKPKAEVGTADDYQALSTSLEKYLDDLEKADKKAFLAGKQGQPGLEEDVSNLQKIITLLNQLDKGDLSLAKSLGLSQDQVKRLSASDLSGLLSEYGDKLLEKQVRLKAEQDKLDDKANKDRANAEDKTTEQILKKRDAEAKRKYDLLIWSRDRYKEYLADEIEAAKTSAARRATLNKALAAVMKKEQEEEAKAHEEKLKGFDVEAKRKYDVGIWSYEQYAEYLRKQLKLDETSNERRKALRQELLALEKELQDFANEWALKAEEQQGKSFEATVAGYELEKDRAIKQAVEMKSSMQTILNIAAYYDALIEEETKKHNEQVQEENRKAAEKEIKQALETNKALYNAGSIKYADYIAFLQKQADAAGPDSELGREIITLIETLEKGKFDLQREWDNKITEWQEEDGNVKIANFKARMDKELEELRKKGVNTILFEQWVAEQLGKMRAEQHQKDLDENTKLYKSMYNSKIISGPEYLNQLQGLKERYANDPEKLVEIMSEIDRVTKEVFGTFDKFSEKVSSTISNMVSDLLKGKNAWKTMFMDIGKYVDQGMSNIVGAIAKGLLDAAVKQDMWLFDTAKKTAKAIALHTMEAYAALTKWFAAAGLGPFAPVAAIGVLAAAGLSIGGLAYAGYTYANKSQPKDNESEVSGGYQSSIMTGDQKDFFSQLLAPIAEFATMSVNLDYIRKDVSQILTALTSGIALAGAGGAGMVVNNIEKIENHFAQIPGDEVEYLKNMEGTIKYNREKGR